MFSKYKHSKGRCLTLTTVNHDKLFEQQKNDKVREVSFKSSDIKKYNDRKRSKNLQRLRFFLKIFQFYKSCWNVSITTGAANVTDIAI